MPKPIFAGFAATLLTTAVLAQDGAPRLPAPNDQVPETARPDSDGAGRETLSEKLQRSDGVIKPPGGVDPEIKTIPPGSSGSAMPVIKPPGDAR